MTRGVLAALFVCVAGCGARTGLFTPTSSGTSGPSQFLLSTGSAFSCAARVGGGVRCWGEGGALGDGVIENSSMPMSVATLTDVVALSAGVAHACAVVADGSVWCWGDNTTGQLGDGTTTNRAVPVRVTGIADAVAVGAGDRHTCAVRVDHSVSCWGDGSVGQLGVGSFPQAPQPVPQSVIGLDDAEQVVASNGFTCARKTNGTVACWGFDGSGQLGNGVMDGASSSPVTAEGLSNIVDVEAHDDGVCALNGAGEISCWGLVRWYGTTTPTPSIVSALGGVTRFALDCDGDFFGIVPDGHAVAAGGASALGNGSHAGSSSATPVAISTIDHVVAIAGGCGHACAVEDGGSVWCWGANYSGQVGDGTTTDRLSPVKVAGL